MLPEVLTAIILIGGIILVNTAGIPQTHFSPGDVIEIYFSQPGVYTVKIVDMRTGYTILEKTYDVQSPGTYVLWATSPQTAEGVYRVYISTGDVIDITIARPAPPIVPLAAIAAAVVVATAFALWRTGLLSKPRPAPAMRPTLLLPNGVRIELGDVNIFGRETFLKLGIPSDIARYVSRTHFAIRRRGGAYYIEDLGSKNGTYVNGVSIKGLPPRRLQDGDIINVAKVLELKYSMA